MNSDVVEVESLRRENASLKETNARLKKLYDQVALELALLKKKIFGKKAEKIPAAHSQLAFALVVDAMARLAGGDESAAAEAKDALDRLRALDREDGENDEGEDDEGDDHGDNDDDVKPTPPTPKPKPKPRPKRKPLSTTTLPVRTLIERDRRRKEDIEVSAFPRAAR